jgi:hypothetical protein
MTERGEFAMSAPPFRNESQVVARFSATLAPNHEYRRLIKALRYFQNEKVSKKATQDQTGEIFYPVSNMCHEISASHIGKTN